MRVIKKIASVKTNAGHYGRNAKLYHYEPARWGVFEDGRLEVMIWKPGSFWEIADPETGRREVPRPFTSAAEAKAYAMELEL
jgi:hypothetical protein